MQAMLQRLRNVHKIPPDKLPSACAAERQALREQRKAERVEAAKDKTVCVKFTCADAKKGKSPFCGLHRRAHENMSSSAKRQGDKQFTAMKKESEEMDEAIDVYLLTVGLPDPAGGKTAGDFDFAAYWIDTKAETNTTDTKVVDKLDHVGFVKFMMTERLKSKEKAEEDWLAAVLDTVKYPTRDFEGPGECRDTLSCSRPECAGGKLRIYVPVADKLSFNN
eukprot:9502157-Pyramimonas_sp.AAC.1